MEGDSLGGGDKSDPPLNRYGTVRADDCPVLYPHYVEQFYELMSQFPSMMSGTLDLFLDAYTDPSNLNYLLVTVDYTTLEVVAGISFMLHPRIATIYVEYMITHPDYRGQGFMKDLNDMMKSEAVRLFPKEYRHGFRAIFTETRAYPDTTHDDYFHCWDGIRKTHTALNRIGFYQCCLNYVMFGYRTEDGLMEEPSSEYVLLIHKDSTALASSTAKNFSLQLDSWYIESLTYGFLRDSQVRFSDVPVNLGEHFLAVLAAVPLDPCPIRTKLPFYRTDKLFPDHYG